MFYFNHFSFVLQVEGAVHGASEDGKNEVKGKFKLWYGICLFGHPMHQYLVNCLFKSWIDVHLIFLS